MDEKKPYQSTAPIRPSYVELYDSLAALQKFGLVINEIGRVYVGFLFENEPSKILAKLKLIKEETGREEFKRIIKRDAQEKTAVFFHNRAENLRYKELRPDEVIPDLDISIVQAKLGLDFKKTDADTIESVVNSLLDDRKTCFTDIGSALIEGVGRYQPAAGNVERPPRSKLHLQYDNILNALKSRAAEKTTTIL